MGETNQTLEDRLSALEQETAAIKVRNSRVEANKSWETSGFRFCCVALLTYLIMNLVLWTIHDPCPPVHALIPTVGFMLSTLTLPRIKRWWIKKYFRGSE